MQILDFSVSNQILSAACPGRLVVAQTRGHLFARFSLDHEWDGLSVTAVFSNDFIRQPYQRTLTAEPVEVPLEVLVPGRLFVSLVGLGDGGVLRLTTKRMDKPLVVHRAGDLVGLTPEESTPELWEQVLAAMGSLSDLKTSDKSSLVAAINEIFQTGGGSGGVSFTTDETLSLKDGVLGVNTADAAEQDNTLPITSAAVHTAVGNIEILLATI